MSLGSANHVVLEGKVTRAERVRYTPAGLAVFDFEVAAGQSRFRKDSVGYFEVSVFDSPAEAASREIRIGSRVRIEGRLWGRKFRNTRGDRVTEVRVIAERCERVGVKHERSEKQRKA